MPETSKKGPQKILRLRYRCLKEYDLEGDRIDTDEFIYESDVSVEDRVQVPKLGKSWPRVLRGRVKGTTSIGREEPNRIDSTVQTVTSATTRHRSVPRLPVLNPIRVGRPTSERDVIPNSDMRPLDPSVENRKIEEPDELPVFSDGSSTAISKYEAVFQPMHRKFED